MKKKEVIHLAKYYKPYSGGMEAVVASIAENCKDRQVSVVASDPDNQEPIEVVCGVKVVRSKDYFSFVSTPMSPKYILNSLRALNSSDAILHVHLPNPLPNLAILIGFFLRLNLPPIVIHWHSDIVKQKFLIHFYKPLMNWLLSKSAAIIVTSEEYLSGSIQLKDFRKKCVVVPIGIESIESRVSPDKVLKIKQKYESNKIIFALGRHVYYKGFEVLIRAASHIEGAVILIGGKGPDTDCYRRMISELGLSEKVFLLGAIPDEDLASYYSAADVFCMPSIEKSEAFGVAQLEAMSVGTPVVSTRIIGSGVPWVNKSGESGLVCEPKDVMDLVKSLKNILDDDELRKELGEGAKQRFSSMFITDNMIEKIEMIYESLRPEHHSGCEENQMVR